MNKSEAKQILLAMGGFSLFGILYIGLLSRQIWAPYVVGTLFVSLLLYLIYQAILRKNNE